MVGKCVGRLIDNMATEGHQMWDMIMLLTIVSLEQHYRARQAWLITAEGVKK